MPAVVARAFEFISAVAGIVFAGVIFYYGILMTITQYNRGQLSLGVQIPEWIYGSFVPLGAFFLLMRFVELLITALRGKAAVREDVLAEALAEVPEGDDKGKEE